MKIGIVSQWYPPEPAFIPGSLAEELAARGHEVRVLTGYPNYPEGRIHRGYRQRWGHRSRHGRITVRRVPLYPSHDASALRRAANYASFALTSSVAAARYLRGVDALYVYHPPASAFAAAAVARLLHRVPVVLHVQDIWPDSVTASPMTPPGRAGQLLHSMLDQTMRRIYRTADSIAVIAPSMRDLLVERGADPAKLRVVLNWTDESLFRPVESSERARTALGHRDRCTVMYAGNLGAFQGVEAAVRAAAAVQHTETLDLVLVGSGTEETSIRALATELGTTNVRFLGRRSPNEMAALYGAADYQLVLLRDLPIFRGTIPSKLQAAFACGSPVLACAPGDSAAIVERSGAGLSCPPEDWRALAERFTQVASAAPAVRAEMARRARETYTAQMSMRQGVDQLEELLMSAAQRRTGVQRRTGLRRRSDATSGAAQSLTDVAP